MKFSLKLAILIFLLLNSIFLLSDEVIIDSVYCAPYDQTGAISNQSYDFQLIVNTLALSVGDSGVGWIPPHIPNATFRSYLTFDISELNSDNNYDLIELYLWVGTEDLNGLISNDVLYEWPEWNIPGGDTLKLLVDHIDFGEYLDTGDWTAGDLGSNQTIESNCTFATQNNYNSETGFLTINITDQIINDMLDQKTKSQFRLRFEIDTDNDSLFDLIAFARYNSIPERVPHINCYYTETNNEEPEVPESVNTIFNFPNPFNPQTTISYSIAEPGNVHLQIYNTKGQLIETLVDEMKGAGDYSVEWNAESQASGIYFYQVKTNSSIMRKKCILLK